MDDCLQTFYDEDAGFAQFCDRYGYASASPEVRKAYRRWTIDQMLDALEEERRAERDAATLDAASAASRAEGMAEGRAEGERVERERWESVVAKKDAEIAFLRSQLEKQDKA